MPSRLLNVAATLLLAGGIGLIVAGTFVVYRPAAVIVAGVMCVLVAVDASR